MEKLQTTTYIWKHNSGMVSGNHDFLLFDWIHSDAIYVSKDSYTCIFSVCVIKFAEKLLVFPKIELFFCGSRESTEVDDDKGARKTFYLL